MAEPALPRITDTPDAAAQVKFRAGTEQRFLVTVDAEEEFDWAQPLRRDDPRTATVCRLSRFQSFCETHGVTPVYMMDYPVASLPLAAELLGDAVRGGRAEIGIQLHPWVNPPHVEIVSERNSFVGSLPLELERAKLAELHSTIARNFGKAPLIYRAGRYGVGPNTAMLLRELGIAFDTSVRARFEYTDIGGPSFLGLPLEPWWVGAPGGLIELPMTTIYAGLLRRIGGWLHPATRRIEALRGVMARTGLLDRIPFTPEGVTIAEALRAVDLAVEDGVPVMVFSFHSPSLRPGHTPYVRSDADLDLLYDWWRAVFARLRSRGVASTSVQGIMASVALA